MMFSSTFSEGEFVKACKELHAVSTVPIYDKRNTYVFNVA